MKNDSMNVYERPEAEEVKLDFESSFLSGNHENPVCTCNEVCIGDTRDE